MLGMVFGPQNRGYLAKRIAPKKNKEIPLYDLQIFNLKFPQ